MPVNPADIILPPLSAPGDLSAAAKDFLGSWAEHASAPQSVPEFFCAKELRRLYPNHSLVVSSDSDLDILKFPDAICTPIDKALVFESLEFEAASRSSSQPGSLGEAVNFGSYKVKWKDFDFILHTLSYFDMNRRCPQRVKFILSTGQAQLLQDFLLAVGSWSNELHEEIFVFQMGFWSKNKQLWKEVQKADWDDVILETSFKEKLQHDVAGFFESMELYKELSIPWKRGLILHGPPGNGKTISLKAILKTSSAQGLPLLYVKSFKTHAGDEYTIATVFQKARHLAPCVLVLEDLDSLINDGNRSFFLNQLDGLEGNDGLLLIGTTNHFDRLDAGISSRPSRFDRKFLFNDPALDERKLYAQFWQKKLSHNQDVEFSDNLVEEFASSTEKFSFAYLKESFVSSLVILAGMKRTQSKAPFAGILKGQIEVLREELNKPKGPSEDDASGKIAIIPPNIAARAMRAVRI